LVENNQTDEVVQQLMTSKQVTTKKILEFFIKDISKQVLETKYTLSLGQLLQAIPNMKCYIFNLIPSKLTLSEPIVTSIAIDRQMVV
jgi:hypothetical protein